jgi:hypothetical protein
MDSANDGMADNLEATLREQIQRKLPGGARAIAIEMDRGAATIVVTGVVRSFYSKQVLYQICRRSAPDFQLIDATQVGDDRQKRAQ